jgi:hypothetical protein
MTLETRTCEHGRPLATSQFPEGGWMGAVGYCQCCLSHYGYIGRSSYSQNESMTESMNPRLCRTCGGKITRHIYKRGEQSFTEIL